MPEIITSDDAQYSLDIVRAICTGVGPGTPGSPQERGRAAFIGKELEAHLGAGNVATEEFAVAPGAFLGSLRISAISMILAAFLNISTGHFAGIPVLVTAAVSLVSSIVALSLFVLGFLFGFELLDRFFDKKQSVNVVGAMRKPGAIDVRRLLIVSGHHDSAWENNWLSLPGYGFFIITATWLLGVVVLLVMAAIQLAGLVSGNSFAVQIGTVSWPLLVYPILPSVAYPLFYNTGRREGGTVPGAADNLAGSALVVALSRLLAKNPDFVPADTEIRFVSFGSEEAGLRGSRRYVERHMDELKHLDARLLNLEIVAFQEIRILTSDINGTVKNSPAMVEAAVAAARRAGVPYRVGSAYLGVATDAGSFSRAGIKATTLLPFKVPEQMLAFYHQKRDAPDVLTIEPLLNVLKVASEWIRGGGE